tara:strand:+ start:2758 stop:3939 length:1182 start_codon:yes stop_codon:yes gene_type:complete
MEHILKKWNNYLVESHSKEDEEELKKISDELKGAVKAHQSQADRIDKILDSTDDEELEEGKKKNCGCGQDPCITYGIQEVKGGDKEDGEYQDTVDDSFDDALNEDELDEKKKKGGKKDACYHKVKSRYKVWPSAYASGALVKCRKVGAKNWGNKSKKKNESFDIFGDMVIEEIFTALINEEGLKDWFDDADGDGQKGWEQIGGKYDGKPCAKQPGQKTKPKCASPEKAASMSKKEKDNAAKRKRAKDPNPNRKGKAKNVNTDPKKESIEMITKQELTEIILDELSDNVYYHITDATYDDGTVAEDVEFWDDVLEEAEYQGRKVTLNKPMKGDVKKSKVYVKNAKGNVVKVNFGDKKMKIKKSNPKRRKSFRARHNCDNPGPKWKARYWSCKAW